MLTKAKQISIEIEEESIVKYDEWKYTLPTTIERAVELYNGGTYLVKAWYDRAGDAVVIFAVTEKTGTMTNYIVAGAVESFNQGGYYLIPITFSEETTIYANGYSIVFVDYRDCLMTLNKIIGTDIKLVSDNTKEELPF